jgi:uncharacterized protein
MAGKKLLRRFDLLLTMLEQQLGLVQTEIDWQQILAARWQNEQFYPIYQQHNLQLSDLHSIEQQKAICVRNTLQFLQGKPANNVLLWGARGTGKSSLIKALLNEYASLGLRLIEIDRQDLINLAYIIDDLRNIKYNFIIFCDDLAFDQHDISYRALKSVLDGSLNAPANNVLIYATSNRRHLMPEFMSENLTTTNVDTELHYSDAVEEKISLAERFGIWLSFYPFKQDEYLLIVRHWLRQLGVKDYDDAAMQQAALQWALARGARSGRTAWQFARDWAGKL